MSNTQSSNLIIWLYKCMDCYQMKIVLRFGRHNHVKNPHPIFSCEKNMRKSSLCSRGEGHKMIALLLFFIIIFLHALLSALYCVENIVQIPYICKSLWSQGIDSQSGGSVRQIGSSYRPARLGIDSWAP
jgi:hypothetical protein